MHQRTLEHDMHGAVTRQVQHCSLRTDLAVRWILYSLHEFMHTRR